MYLLLLKRNKSEPPIRVIFVGARSPKRSIGSLPSAKPSACPFPLRQVRAPHHPVRLELTSVSFKFEGMRLSKRTTQ